MSASTYKKYDSPSSMYQTSTKRNRQGLSQSAFQQIKEAFDLFDPNHIQSISYHQLKVIMRALGFDVKKSEVVQLARQYDVEQSGRVLFQDYVEIMRKKYAERDPIQQILKAFRLFDNQGKGKIGLSDLRKVARELGEGLRQEQLIAMIEQFDKDGDGMINEQEFLAIIRPSVL